MLLTGVFGRSIHKRKLVLGISSKEEVYQTRFDYVVKRVKYVSMPYILQGSSNSSTNTVAVSVHIHVFILQLQCRVPCSSDVAIQCVYIETAKSLLEGLVTGI